MDGLITVDKKTKTSVKFTKHLIGPHLRHLRPGSRGLVDHSFAKKNVAEQAHENMNVL